MVSEQVARPSALKVFISNAILMGGSVSVGLCVAFVASQNVGVAPFVAGLATGAFVGAACIFALAKGKKHINPRLEHHVAASFGVGIGAVLGVVGGFQLATRVDALPMPHMDVSRIGAPHYFPSSHTPIALALPNVDRSRLGAPHYFPSNTPK